MERAEELTNPLVKIVMDKANRSLYDRKYIIKTLIPHFKFMKKFVDTINLRNGEETIEVDIDELIHLLDFHTHTWN